MKRLGKMKIGAEVEGEPRRYKLAQIWTDLETKSTFYLATEDGKPVQWDEGSCLVFHHYRMDPPLRGLLIVQDQGGPGAKTFGVEFCPVHRKVRLHVHEARIPYRDVEGVMAMAV